MVRKEWRKGRRERPGANIEGKKVEEMVRKEWRRGRLEREQREGEVKRGLW